MVGILSSVIAAMIGQFCISIIYPLPWLHAGENWPLRDVYGLGFYLSAGGLVYPACWYYLIHRCENYSHAQTATLVTYTFLISCVVVSLAFFGWGIWAVLKEIVPSHPQSHSWLGLMVFPIGAMILTIIGSSSFLIPYILFVFPIAYLQRYLLLRFFGHAAR